MRLLEFDQPSLKSMVTTYLQQGYELIGKGASAMVLAKGNGDIVKIGKSNDCWLNYAQAIKGMSNPHVPKIAKLQVYDAFYVAEVERLKEIPETFFRTKLYKQMVCWMSAFGGWSNGRIVYLGQMTPEQIKKQGLIFKKENPELAEVLRTIKACKGSCSYDMHPDNLMKRGNTLVINDPLANLN